MLIVLGNRLRSCIVPGEAGAGYGGIIDLAEKAAARQLKRRVAQPLLGGVGAGCGLAGSDVAHKVIYREGHGEAPSGPRSPQQLNDTGQSAVSDREMTPYRSRRVGSRWASVRRPVRSLVSATTASDPNGALEDAEEIDLARH
jgi:hypothetical protein